MERVNRISVYVDRTGETLTVWFGDPKDEYICEHTKEDIIFMKDKQGNVLGFEKLFFSVPPTERLQCSFEEFPVEEWVAKLSRPAS